MKGHNGEKPEKDLKDYGVTVVTQTDNKMPTKPQDPQVVQTSHEPQVSQGNAIITVQALQPSQQSDYNPNG